MAERSRVAVLISGRGSNMAALIYASRADDCPYEVALVSGDKPDAPGLALAEAEGIDVVKLDAKALVATFWTKINHALEKANIDLIALADLKRLAAMDLPPYEASTP